MCYRQLQLIMSHKFYTFLLADTVSRPKSFTGSATVFGRTCEWKLFFFLRDTVRISAPFTPSHTHAWLWFIRDCLWYNNLSWIIVLFVITTENLFCCRCKSHFIYLFYLLYILIAAAKEHQIYLYLKFYNVDPHYVPCSWHRVNANVAKTFIWHCS